jgi:S-adenosylmethionine-diacylgycerolhomoserine-N-methlytransferase
MRLISAIVWLFNEIQTICHLLFTPIRGITHKERLESFYAGQAKNYDSYRENFLSCREPLLDKLPVGGIWVDMGGGTGFNIEYMAKLGRLKCYTKVHLVDLTPSLLEIAVRRIKENGWTNVEIIEADATSWQPREQKIDLVTFSYSLTMIPDWFLAIENAKKILKVDGHIGAADLYISRKYPEHGFKSHSWFRRIFWMMFFGFDNVNISSDHLCYLHKHFQTSEIIETLGSVPYIPFIKVPHYIYIGQNSSTL